MTSQEEDEAAQRRIAEGRKELEEHVRRRKERWAEQERLIREEGAKYDFYCYGCRGSGLAVNRTGRETYLHCPSCGAIVSFNRNRVEIKVSGSDATEVESVTRHLVDVTAARRELSQLRSPWFSGLFYLTCLTVVISALLVAGNVINLWALPVVVIGAALLVSIVGALQMRQDNRLSERGFIQLMGDVLRRLPLLLARPKAANQTNPPNSESSGK